MHLFRKPLAAAAAALTLAACGAQETEADVPSTPVVEDSRTPAQREAERTPYQLDSLFAQAAQEFRVPADLLKAYSYSQTRWEMVRGEEEFEGMAPAFGLMALRGEALARGATLAGVTEEQVRTQPLANIRAAAALLSEKADALGLAREDLGAWAPAVAALSGIADEEAQAYLVHREVYQALRTGAVAQTPAGDVAVSMMPRAGVQAQFRELPTRAMASGPDYAASIWRPSPNYNARPAGTDISMIVIHTCEGSYSSCWSWLANSASGVSAHYVVNESGSEITQLVSEANRGWHVGASYDCGLNGSVMCGLNGSSVNNFSVGIEHGGFASQSSFPAGQIDASARLSCDISRDRTVVRDSYHIVAHGRLQPASRTDPGPNWPWSTYISKVQSYCGTTSSSIIIDSNNNNNDTAKGYVEVTGASWVSSTNVGGYYGSGYFAAPTAAVSEPVTFYFYLPAAATKTIDAWWTSATDRSTTTPFVIWNAAGTKLGTVNVNQQLNGGRWNTLGTYSFSAGWNKVQVSRWTGSGYQVIADAIQVR